MYQGVYALYGVILEIGWTEIMPEEENYGYGEVCAMAGKMRFRCVDKDGQGDMTFVSLRYEGTTPPRPEILKACGRKIRRGKQSLLRRD
jgi:hypothetical protein